MIKNNSQVGKHPSLNYYYLTQIDDTSYQSYRNTKSETLIISLTDKCPLSCPHCGTNSSSKKNNTLDINPLKNFLSESIRQSETKYQNIVLTGGEPSIYPQLVSDLTKLAHNNCRKTLLVTGCAWARNKLTIKSFFKQLENVPDFFLISLDAFHLMTQSRSVYESAFRECNERNINVKILFSHSSILSNEEIDCIDFIDYLVSQYENIQGVWPQALRPTGRAQKLLDDAFSYSETVIKAGCQLLSAPNIDSNGNIYPCCGDWHDENTWTMKSKSILSAGNIYADSPKEILDSLENSRLYELLSTYGPRLLSESLNLEDDFTDCKTQCDYCHIVCSNFNNLKGKF